MSKHNHDHEGHGSHQHHVPDNGRNFVLGIALNTIIVVLQITFGILSGSVALLSDAAHNASDVLGLALGYGAIQLGRRPPTLRQSFGWQSASIYSALINSLFLTFTTALISFEAVRRLLYPGRVDAFTVMLVASAGLVCNGATAWFLYGERQHGLNNLAAFQHMFWDAVLTLGIIIGALAIKLTDWWLIDPLLSLALSTFVVWRTFGTLVESIRLALHMTPREIDVEGIDRFLRQLPGVVDMHELHIWALSDTSQALMVHLVVANVMPDTRREQLIQELRHHWGLDHITIQMEPSDPAHPCYLAPIA